MSPEREFELRMQLGSKALGFLIVLRRQNELPPWIRALVDDVLAQLDACNAPAENKKSAKGTH